MGSNHFSNDHNIRPASRVSRGKFSLAWWRGFFSPSGQGFIWGLVLLVVFLVAGVDFEPALHP